jgi:PAS fold
MARGFISNLSTPAFLVDQQGVLVYYNEAAEEILGLTFAEAGPMPADQSGPGSSPPAPTAVGWGHSSLSQTLQFRASELATRCSSTTTHATRTNNSTRCSTRPAHGGRQWAARGAPSPSRRRGIRVAVGTSTELRAAGDSDENDAPVRIQT